MNHSWKTRVLALFLAVVVVVGLMPMAVFAEEVTEPSAPTETTEPVVSEETLPEVVDEGEPSGDDVQETEEAEAYTITFNANGGTGTMESQTILTGTLTKNAFTYATHTFLGWNTEAKGTGTAYADEAEITLTGDITLYAQWHDDYYKTVSHKKFNLAPGVVESEVILNNAAGTHQQVAHVVEVDIHNEYTKVIPSFKGMAEGLAAKEYGTQIMSQQAAYAEANGYGNVVAAMNISLSWYDTAYYKEHPELVGEPLGYMILDGVQYTNSQGQTAGAQTCLVINFDEKDGVARPADMPKVAIRSTADAITGWEEQVIPANFTFLVKDGVNQYKEDHVSDPASRSFIGVKADGTIVMVMNDGRQSPYSAGFNSYEMAEFMLSLGCVYASNGDGGGSSTFLSQRPGEELKLNCSPSDGAERPTTHGILVISTAPADGAFAVANITSEAKYYTPGSTVTFQALGTDLVGTEAEIPADVSWQIKEENMGSISNGVFVSNGNAGSVTAQMVYKEKVVGECTIEMVVPETIRFGQSIMTIPYGKEVSLKPIATINGGLNEVVLNPSDITFSFTNEELGTLNGFAFTAVSESATISSNKGTVTAVLNCEPSLKATAEMSLGKGSEVLFDFESEEDLDAWNTGDVNGNDLGFVQEMSIATRKDGQVHDGEGSLRLLMNPVSAPGISNGGYGQLDLYLDEPVIVENAKSIGFWAYIPDEYEHCWIRVLYWYDPDGDGKFDKKNTVTVINQPEVYNTMDESGWKYFSVDVSAYSKVMIAGANAPDKITYTNGKNDANNFRFVEFMLPHTNTNDLWKTYGTLNGPQTIYIDNITADYSDAVDDREAPIFNTVSLSVNDEGVALKKNAIQTTTSNSLSVMATVAEDTKKTNATGLNAASAKAYVDGVEVPCTFSNGRMSIADVAVADGVHRVKFEIADNMGNKSVVIRLIKVNSGIDASTVQLVPQDATLDRLYGGSVYWMDLKATDIETIQSVSMRVDLNSLNHWELDHTVYAAGFTGSYTIDAENNAANITITRTGNNTQTGEAVIASLPIRVVYYDTDIHVEGYDAKSYWETYGFWPYDLKVDVDMGMITYVSDYISPVHNGFSNEEFSVDTELYAPSTTMDPAYKAEKGTAHVHTVTALEDKAATCTMPGYTGRTYCEVCDSVVDWGVEVPATGHSYDFDAEGVLKCVCGELFTGVHTDGKAYVDGVVISDGWINDSYYKDGVVVTGIQKVPASDGSGEFYYDFGEDGICAGQQKYNGLLFDGEVYRYAYMGVPTSGWKSIGDEWYYFSSSTMAAAQGKVKVDGLVFEFEETGKLVSGIWVYAFNGYRYYYGPGFYGRQWYEIDGEWYYFENGLAVTGYRKVSNRGDLNNISWHYFDEKGACQGKLNGIHMLNGRYQYFEDGCGKKQCLFELDGNYYFADADGYLVTNQRFYAYATNCDLPVASYYFDEEGKMIGASAEGEIVTIDDTLYYYVDGRPNMAGLIKIGEDYYFADVDGVIAVGSAYVWKTNGYVTEGRYLFAQDGKMVGTGPDGAIVDVDGTKYFYKDGVATYAGLMVRDGYYYYAGTNGVLATGAQVVAKTNDLLPKNTYYFDSEGRMLGVQLVDGNTVAGEIVDGVYYKTGRPTAAGLIEHEGYFYFADTNGKIATGMSFVWKTNGLLGIKEDHYYFAADGKLYGAKVVDGETITGEIVAENDGLYYYANGKTVAAGLIELDGGYYFADVGGKIVTGRKYVWRTNGLLPEGSYTFDATGKMLGAAVEDGIVVSGEIVEIDGTRYYYKNGNPTPAGLVEVDGYFYFAGLEGKIATGRSYVWKDNGILPMDNYQFGADGKMLGMRSENGEIVVGEIVNENGGLYYYERGKTAMAGLIELDGHYYFADVGGEVVTGRKYVWKTNGIIPEQSCYFDEDGRMIGLKVVDGEKVVGEIIELDGVRYYYENGVAVPAGMVEVDGYFYFADVGGVIATGRKYVWKTNGMLEMDTYYFHEDGKMMGMKLVDGNLVSGELVNVDGSLYYYSNGKATMAGLVEIDGYYYFADVGGKIATGKCYVWNGNGIITEKSCYFDEDGKMAGLKIVDGEKIVGEIVEIDGVRYYYENGAGVRKGIVYIDGYYYFANTDGKLVVNQKFYVWKEAGNGLLADELHYTFDELGRVIG